MHRNCCSKVVRVFCGVLAIVVSCAPSVVADYSFGQPTAIPGAGGAIGARGSADGLELYFAKPSADTSSALWVMRRSSIKEPWGAPVRVDLPVNGPVHRACVSPDGLELYLSEGPIGTAAVTWAPNPSGYGNGQADLWVSRRTTREDPWGAPENLGPNVNTKGLDEYDPSITADGLSLCYVRGGLPPADLLVTTRSTKQDPWGPAVPISFPAWHGDGWDHPFLSGDGLVLLFTVYHFRNPSVHISRRQTIYDPWAMPEDFILLGGALGGDTCVSFLTEDSTLYLPWLGVFSQGPVHPVLDFNGDGKVDDGDVSALLSSSGSKSYYPQYDIAPSAFGNSIVDWQDLVVLMEGMGGRDAVLPPGPNSAPNLSPHAFASDVPCNVVLSWSSPDCAPTHDVYFGTSRSAVESAERTFRPGTVKISLDQTATTYDPPGLLEFAKTYYWRVDEVIAPLGSRICRGRVMQFTAETEIKPIPSVTATASSSSSDTTGPMKTVDGSGLDTLDTHGTNQGTMWLSKKGDSPAWIQYEFDKAYQLAEMWVWNANQAIEATSLAIGAKDVVVEYSLDGTTWTTVAGWNQFARATGKSGYARNTVVNFPYEKAKYVRITITSNWGGKTVQYGLSEVRFFYLPERDY